MQQTNSAFPWKRNILAILALTVILYSGYQLSNRFHITAPQYLPLSALDQAIPFLLWTVWPYFLLVLLAFLPLGIRDTAIFWRAMIAYTVAITINISIWLLFPTVYARPQMPDGSSFTRFAYHWLCSIDTPANCLPSGHITSPAIGCWALSAAAPKYRTRIWTAFLLLSVTILTTKQHYVVDLPAGLLTAFIGIRSSKGLYRKFENGRMR
jgi:hypothetical protein